MEPSSEKSADLNKFTRLFFLEDFIALEKERHKIMIITIINIKDWTI